MSARARQDILQPVGASGREPIRVMVVDDSAIVRGLITRQLQTDSSIAVVCTAPNGEQALTEVKRREIDVVVLDIEMPVMDGLTALPLMLAQRPGLRIVVASTLTRRNAELSLKALHLGAADYLSKPEGTLAAAEDFKRELLEKVRTLGARRGVHPPSPSARAPVAVAVAPATPRKRPAVLAIGASTGGPPALLNLFAALRGAAPQPILLTQHMPPAFTSLLAEQLSRVGERPCQEGQDGEPILPGRCYVAPGGWHMTAEVGRAGPTIRLNQEPPEHFCRPAVDPMLRSLAKVYGSGVLAVILTGMGSDGAKGCVAVREAGGRFVVQDEATSVVWGMPGAAAQTGMAEKILPLDDIGPWTRLTTGAAA